MTATPVAPKSRNRRLALRVAAAGFLAAVPLTILALPATASAATPDGVTVQQIDQPDWQNNNDHDRDNHDRDRGDHDRDRGNHDNDNNNPQPAPWQPPSTGSFG